MLYHIITYGCQMNHSDSERIAAILKSAKVIPAKNIKEADLLIINSCSVRQSAINRIYGQLINFKKIGCHPERSPEGRSEGSRAIKTNIAIPRDSSVSANRRMPRNNKKITILTGCVLETDKKKLKDNFDLIIDIKELTNPKNNELKKMLKLLNPRAGEQEFKAFNYTDYFKINPQYRSSFSAYIPIMTGCNNFCAYCAVPYTRGREVSRPANEIIKEIKRLIKKGYKEITLLGQNVNSYKSEMRISDNLNKSLSSVIASFPSSRRKARQSLNSHTQQEIASVASLPRNDNKNQLPIKNKTINFPQLLKMINDIPGNFWIRFLTNHPKDMSDELIKTMAQCAKVCEYVHLPIQSGDDKILQKMNRRYTGAHYLKLIKKIKQAYLEVEPPSTLGGSTSKLWHPPIAISTDIIVGFPGETKAQFANTAKIMRAVKYDMAYLAQYSPRAGTAAAKLKDSVSNTEKKQRKEFLNEILRKTALENNKKYEGKIVEVLIENPPVGKVNKFTFGKTRTFKNVKIHKGSSNKLIAGQFAQIKITQAEAWGLKGEIIDEI